MQKKQYFTRTDEAFVWIFYCSQNIAKYLVIGWWLQSCCSKVIKKLSCRSTNQITVHQSLCPDLLESIVSLLYIINWKDTLYEQLLKSLRSIPSVFYATLLGFKKLWTIRWYFIVLLPLHKGTLIDLWSLRKSVL